MDIIRTLLLAMLIQGDGSSAEYSPEEARHFINLRNQSVRSFDVDLSSVTMQYFTTDLPKDFTPSTRLKKKSEFRPLSPEDAISHTSHFHQMFLNDSNGVHPMRRIEVYSDDDKTFLNVLAFDGSNRRVLQPAQETGLIGGPAKDYSVYAGIGEDYLEILGFFYRGQPIVNYFQSPSIKVVKDDSLLLVEAFDGPESGNVPMNGYRIWLDPVRGMCPTQFEHYQVYPKIFNSEEIGGDDVKHVRYKRVIEDFLQLEDNIWVPIKALTTQNKIEWTPGKSGSVKVLKLYDTTAIVNAEKSRWNKGVDEKDFAFDFPPATRVRNELLGVDIVVGKQSAGRNIDELLANAASVIPVDHPRYVKSTIKDKTNWNRLHLLLLLNGAILCACIIYVLMRRHRRRLS
ncbi:hypothetical protein [Gimesia fumaroli]|uniref:Uncharacterized protein n=1 Tax=Gimesia fumaroli TaxID=2527976 RepID=A0A518I9E4_9PLAN|nr:hypothetical protein [Gimesia fumaroli]QDV49717.1 hypothetical protein Enr17x_17380 [Gimesia fumaroli]